MDFTGSDKNGSSTCELTVLMPCLNEAETLPICIKKAKNFLSLHQVEGEVLIADNGSTDGSPGIAADCGARVIHVEQKGYGSALYEGIKEAKGRFIIMGDADDSYDFTSLMPFLSALRDGNQLVMGNRFRGGIKPGSMPLLHRYLGNPVLSGIGRIFFNSTIGDFHCGLRGFDKNSILQLNLQTKGMEFASEMVVKATINNLHITEVPTTLSPDGRNRPPHLNSWRDGWRHLRFLLLYSPRWLFLYPGLVLLIFGLLGILWLTPGPVRLETVTFDIHSLLYSAVSLILGVQLLSFSLFAKTYGTYSGYLQENDKLTMFMAAFTLERGLIVGFVLLSLGLISSVYAIYSWGSSSFGDLIPSSMMRLTIPALTSITIGIQIVFSTFLLSVFLIPSRHTSNTPENSS